MAHSALSFAGIDVLGLEQLILVIQVRLLLLKGGCSRACGLRSWTAYSGQTPGSELCRTSHEVLEASHVAPLSLDCGSQDETLQRVSANSSVWALSTYRHCRISSVT